MKKSRELSPKQLASKLGVLPSSLNAAARQGYKCGGFPVSKWKRTKNKRIVKYVVPAGVVLRVK